MDTAPTTEAHGSGAQNSQENDGSSEYSADWTVVRRKNTNTIMKIKLQLVAADDNPVDTSDAAINASQRHDYTRLDDKSAANDISTTPIRNER